MKKTAIIQFFTKQITNAANSADLILASITYKPCVIKSIIVKSNGATTADLTSIAVYGGTSNAITFIDSTSGAKANIDAVNKQVSWTGVVLLETSKTIIMDFTGTGATAIDLTVTIEYFATVFGGYLI